MVVVTQAELAALLRVAGVAPAPTSPLAGLQPSPAGREVVAALSSKGAVSANGAIAPEWRALIGTLADPMVQANLHIEGTGSVQYFGGAGGIVGFMPRDGDYGVDAGLSLDSILGDANFVLSWRVVADAPALRVDLSVQELTVLAAMADAYREEELLACIERRDARSGAVARDVAERLVAAGTEHADSRWLVSILAQYCAQGSEPASDHLDPGGASLLSRKLAEGIDNALVLVKDLRTVCMGLAGTGPFMALAVHAPWDDPQIKLFTRGVEHFWGIEYGVGASGRVRVSRLGARAMESLLRQFLSPFEQYSVRPAPEPAPRAAARPPAPPAVPEEHTRVVAPPAPAARAVVAPPAPVTAPAPSPRACPKCGRTNKPKVRFCTGCGTALAH